MTKQPAPYSAILPTILCQQPAVILHWLNEQRATGNLPVEIVLDVLIELVSRQTTPPDSILCTRCGKPVSVHAVRHGICNILEGHEVVASDTLEVYKRAVKALRIYVPLEFKGPEPRYRSKEAREAWDAIAAVDKLEGVE